MNVPVFSSCQNDLTSGVSIHMVATNLTMRYLAWDPKTNLLISQCSFIFVIPICPDPAASCVVTKHNKEDLSADMTKNVCRDDVHQENAQRPSTSRRATTPGREVDCTRTRGTRSVFERFVEQYASVDVPVPQSFEKDVEAVKLSPHEQISERSFQQNVHAPVSQVVVDVSDSQCFQKTIEAAKFFQPQQISTRNVDIPVP